MSNFSYSTAVIQSLEDAHSGVRLTRYTAAVGGSVKDAIDLYVWNAAVSSAFYGPLQAVEVGFRNALSCELSRMFGQNWYDDSQFLSLNAPYLIESFEGVKASLIKNRKSISAPQIVASLSFGFWNHLLGSGPHGVYVVKLWNAGLHRAFPSALTKQRGLICGEIKSIRDLRNRIAHHEPIFYRNLQKEYDRIKEVSTWMYRDLAEWVDYHSRCQEIINHRPHPRQCF